MKRKSKTQSEIPLEHDKVRMRDSTVVLITVVFILTGLGMYLALMVGGCAYKGSINVTTLGNSDNLQDAASETDFRDALKDFALLKDIEANVDEVQVGPDGFVGPDGLAIPALGGGQQDAPHTGDIPPPVSGDTPPVGPTPPLDDDVTSDMPPPPPPDPDDTGGLDERFLWKPKSEPDGRLVNLTPQSLTLDQLAVRGESGTLRSRANGNRQHWRFAKPGAAYGVNIPVTGSYKGRVIVRYTVPNGGQRYSKKLEQPPAGGQTHIKLNGRGLTIGADLKVTRISGNRINPKGSTKIGGRIGGPFLTSWVLPVGDEVFFQMETVRKGRLYHVFTRAGKVRRYQYLVGGDRTLNEWDRSLHTYREDWWKHWGDTQPKNKGKYEYLKLI